MKRELMVVSTLLWLSAVSALGVEEERFIVGEWDVSPFGTYVDKVNKSWGVGCSITYFVTDNIGVGGTTFWTDFGGTMFDNAAAEAYYRLPLFERFAPYAVGGVGYQFDSHEGFETFG